MLWLTPNEKGIADDPPPHPPSPEGQPHERGAMTMRAVTYSRFSSDQQNPASAADQTAACRRYAQAQGWQVVGG